MNNNTWILTSGRSGSTHLCDLLNNTGLFPIYDHSWHWRDCPNKAFAEWLAIFGTKHEFEKYPPKTCKAIYGHYTSLFGYDVTPDYLDTILPGIKYIKLYRHDTFAHAVSYYYARATNTYTVHNQEDLDAYMAKSIEGGDDLLVDCYNEVKTFKSRWSEFPGHVVFYEDLVNDPITTLVGILNFLGLDTTVATYAIEQTLGSDKHLFRMTRLEVDATISRLKGLV